MTRGKSQQRSNGFALDFGGRFAAAALAGPTSDLIANDYRNDLLISVSKQCPQPLWTRSDGKPWRIGTEVYGDHEHLPRDVISRKPSVPNVERIFFVRHALRAGFSIEEIFNLTKIDRGFLVQIKEVVDFEEELAATIA